MSFLLESHKGSQNNQYARSMMSMLASCSSYALEHKNPRMLDDARK